MILKRPKEASCVNSGLHGCHSLKTQTKSYWLLILFDCEAQSCTIFFGECEGFGMQNCGGQPENFHSLPCLDTDMWFAANIELVTLFQQIGYFWAVYQSCGGTIFSNGDCGKVVSGMCNFKWSLTITGLIIFESQVPELTNSEKKLLSHSILLERAEEKERPNEQVKRNESVLWKDVLLPISLRTDRIVEWSPWPLAHLLSKHLKLLGLCLLLRLQVVVEKKRQHFLVISAPLTCSCFCQNPWPPLTTHFHLKHA